MRFGSIFDKGISIVQKCVVRTEVAEKKLSQPLGGEIYPQILF